MYQEEKYLMLSGLQHFAFCRRQWALIHIEQQWEDNYKTTAGELFHHKVHDGTSFEKRGNTMIARGYKISSSELGFSGECDVIEFRKSKSGITLNGIEGDWTLTPIEYKRGKPKENQEDELQLCAQAICLEEKFLTKIPKGYLFYGETKRRTEVLFTDELRQKVYNLSNEMHQLFSRGHTPMVKATSKCASCSLKDICVPTLNKYRDVKEYITKNIKGEL